ncbi:MAG: hypothetical protein GF383_00975 [Candidatus Lokiarchaeota archaeon]|nr:hypothetical protein [Candidatus Lokiarchaeota archaeon]MBD3337786.1 hypothetical protein [Candidatus Lokiarchaeota archaeon]
MKNGRKSKSQYIKITRENWEQLREFRKAPFQKRYHELLELEEKFFNATKNSIFD